MERRESQGANQRVCAHHTPATGGEVGESHGANQVYALATHQLQVERRGGHRALSSGCTRHTPATGGGGERVIEPIKWMRVATPPATGGERERSRANQVDALTTHQLQVERRKRVIEPIKCMRSPHTNYRCRGERVIEPIKWMRSPHTSNRWRGERAKEQSSVCAHTPQLQVERRRES